MTCQEDRPGLLPPCSFGRVFRFTDESAKGRLDSCDFGRREDRPASAGLSRAIDERYRVLAE
jgi:hypothetical protein